MNRLFRSLSKASPNLVAIVATAVCILIVVAERNSGVSESLWVLHLLPVMVVIWRGGLPLGLVIAGISLLLGNTEWTADGTPHIDPGAASELTFRGAVFIIFGLLTDAGTKTLGETEDEVNLDLSSGLASSAAFNELLSLEVERAQRYDRCFTLAYVCIENVGAAHQRSGRVATEDALRRIGHQIKGSLRSNDVVARRGGQEFAVLLPETGDEAAQSVLQRLQRRLGEGVADEASYLSFSIGAVTWVRCGMRVDQLHQVAYQALYKSRQAGQALNHEVLYETSEVVTEQQPRMAG